MTFTNTQPAFGVIIGDDAARIAVANALVLGSRAEFRQHVVDLLAEHPEVREIVIDLGAGGYVDTTGWGVLLSCTRRCETAGVALVLEGLSEETIEYLRQHELAALFEIRTTPQEPS